MKRYLSLLFCAIALPSPPIYAAQPLARCYLMHWDRVFGVAPFPQQVREWADVRCSVETQADLAKLKAILQLDRLQTGAPPTRDLRFVVDIRQADGHLESIYADPFCVMSADFNRWRKIGRSRREIDSFVRRHSPKSSNQTMQRTATRRAIAFSNDQNTSTPISARSR